MAVDHIHLIIRATVEAAPVDVEAIKADLRELVDLIDMKLLVAYSQPKENWVNPMATYCEEPGNEGMTAIALIETSSITFHAWDHVSPNLVELDCYSCRSFSKETVLTWLDRYRLISHKFLLIDRGVDLRVVDQG